MKITLAYVIALLALSAGTAGASQSAAESIEPQQLVQGDRAAIHATQLRRTRSQREWFDLWKDLGPAATRGKLPPQVDFANEQLLTFIAGDQRLGGAQVVIRRIKVLDDRLSLDVELSLPGPGCISTMALTQPYQIVRIPRTLPERPTDFKYRIVRFACDRSTGQKVPAATSAPSDSP